ncbi:MAG: hypothetical protein JSV49_08490, partial [Thermoplasmata archaeon]
MNIKTNQGRLGSIIKFHLLFVLCLGILIFTMFLSSTPADAEIQGSIDDASPLWLNRTSEPVVVINLTLHNNSLGDTNPLNWINVTFQNITGFNASSHLAPLTLDPDSGVLIYNESNGIEGFQPDDTEIVGGFKPWGANSTHWWANLSMDGGYNLPNTMPTSPNFYVVLNVRSDINISAQFMVNITENHINTTRGSAPSTQFYSKIINIDTYIPESNADAISKYWQTGLPLVITATA